MASTTKKVDHAGLMFQFCRNHIVCDHWSINSPCLHPPILHWYKLTEDKQKWYHLAVHLLHTSVQVTKFCLLNTLHASSTLPHFEMASSGTLSKHPQCSHIFHKCQASYSTERHQTHNDFEWAVCNNCLPSSDPKPALGLITWRKVKFWELVPSHCSWWKSCINFSGCPS